VWEWGICLPSLLQRGFERGGRDLQIHEKIRVRAVAAVAGALGGERQGLFGQRDVGGKQEGAVEEEGLVFAALGVAGELEAANHQVGVASYLDGLFEQRGQSRPMVFQDEIICARNALERCRVIGAQNQGVVEQARTLQNSPAASAAAENRNG